VIARYNESHPQAFTFRSDDWMMQACIVMLYTVLSQNYHFLLF